MLGRRIYAELTAERRRASYSQVQLDWAAFESLGMSAPRPRLRVIPGGQRERSNPHLVPEEEEIP